MLRACQRASFSKQVSSGWLLWRTASIKRSCSVVWVSILFERWSDCRKRHARDVAQVTHHHGLVVDPPESSISFPYIFQFHGSLQSLDNTVSSHRQRAASKKALSRRTHQSVQHTQVFRGASPLSHLSAAVDTTASRRDGGLRVSRMRGLDTASGYDLLSPGERASRAPECRHCTKA